MPNRIRTTGWLSFFLFLLVLATTALLLGLLTPSWQIVYLEDGRTEHHHGLWLDCKRDFSYDYGRPREYYETLHRRFDLVGPFDQFWLPSLNCVFKFDYWLDEEDWFEHNYDENKLWGDAYQHLFLGWKIASLAAHLLSVICALFAVISLFCAFCHRLCTCIAAVLVVIAVLAGLVGNILFYLFASDQDNNIIKEEDGIYEQHFGWSFWVSLIGNFLMLFCSMIGCLATKSVLGKGRRTKFIKIQLNDFDDDNAHLLNQICGTNGSSTGTTSIGSLQHPQQQSFRRSRSTVYKIDSQELRSWEKEAMRSIRQKQKAQMSQFKRTNSMPSMKKGGGIGQSNSDISQAITEPIQTKQFTPHRQPILSNQQQNQNGGNPSMDIIYEYVDQQSFNESTLKMIEGKQQTPIEDKRKMRASNFYDPVPLASTSIGGVGLKREPPKGKLIQPISTFPGDSEYLAPKSLSSADNSSISTGGRRTPLIVPLLDAKGISSPMEQRPIGWGSSTFGVDQGGQQCPPQIPLSTFPIGKPPMAKSKSRMETEERTKELDIERDREEKEGPKPPIRSISTHRLYQPTILSEVPPILGDNAIRINTFQTQQNGPINHRFSKSITNLLPMSSSTQTQNPLAARLFDRRLTESSERSTIEDTLTSSSSNGAPTFLGRSNGGGNQQKIGTIRDRLESILSSPNRRAPSEMDRSIGSSRTATFLGQIAIPSSSPGDGSADGKLDLSTATEESESNITVIQRNVKGMEFGQQAWTDV